MKQHLLSLLTLLLFPLGQIYAFIMKIRRTYFKKAKKQFIAPIPVISVGNISWGGTGKTPIVDYLLDLFKNKNLKTAVLSRGYGGKPPHTPLLVDSKKHKASESGDEPLMLAHAHEHTAILVDPKRVESAKYALENLFADVFILDDGFQHLKIKREIDLVLLTKEDLDKGYNKVIPSGTWREPKSALQDASAFLIKSNKEDWKNIKAQFTKKFLIYNKPLFAFNLQPLTIHSVFDSEKNFDSTKEYAFITGIGKPEQALESVETFTGKKTKLTKYYKDHYFFTQNDADYLKSLNMQIVCTHKDAIKLKEFDIPQLYYLKTKAIFHSSFGSDSAFDEWLNNTIKI